MSQKSVDIQTRPEDQHSVSSMEKALADNRRQSQFSLSSGKFKTSTSPVVCSLLAENQVYRYCTCAWVFILSPDSLWQ